MNSINNLNKEKQMKTVIGLTNEYEGNGTLWLDLAEPEHLASYIINNMERGDKYEFTIKEMSDEEFNALDNGD